ncbi:ABC transporter permease [Roseomonas sp. BN140053]|uniref:ABC transporter permease n=1 Tax=Roseomonas sp. BN140053 TaxID=3391898 RepID=UPI0039EA4BCA
MSDVAVGRVGPVRGEAVRRARRAAPALPLFVQQCLLVVVLLLLWEAAGAWLVDPFWCSRPSWIAERLWMLASMGDLHRHVIATVSEAGIGLGMGAVVGVILGLLMARFTRASQVAEPLFMGLYSLPRVALAPLFVLWFGIGLLSKVMMSFSMVVFVFVLNVLEGVRSLDRDPIDLMRTMRATPFFIARKVLLPAVLPWIFAAFRLGVGLSLIGAVVGELIGSSQGLGWYIERSAGQLDTTGVFAGIITLIVLAMLANQAVAILSRRLSGWRS